MSIRNLPDPDRRRGGKPAAPPARRRSGLSLLLLWPFHLFTFFTRAFSLPVRLLLRAAGYPLVAGVYALVAFAVSYGIQAQRYDLSKIHDMPERSIVLDRLGEEIGRIHGEKRSIVALDGGQRRATAHP